MLRGGSEARRSNAVLAAVIAGALESAAYPIDAIQLVPFTDRDAIRILIRQTETIDLAIPRGGEALIRFVTEHARVPVIGHFAGVCHLFVDDGYDVERAIALVLDGKARRPGVCNALETLLVHAATAEALLPKLDAALVDAELHHRPRHLRRDAREHRLGAEQPNSGGSLQEVIRDARVDDGNAGDVDDDRLRALLDEVVTSGRPTRHGDWDIRGHLGSADGARATAGNELLLTDLTGGELLVLGPLIVLVFWLGVFPGTFLHFSEPAISNILALVGR